MTTLVVLLFAAAFNSCVPKTGKQQDMNLMTPAGKILSEDKLQKAYADFVMASLYATEGNYTEARAFLEKAIENHPGSMYLHREMSNLLREMKEYEKAVEHARICVDIDPKDVESHILLAEAYTLLHDDASAKREYEKILELDPNQHRSRLFLVAILIRGKEYESALVHLNELVKQDPNLVIAHYYLGRIHLESKRFQEAEKSYLEALRLSNTMEPALFDLGSLYQMEKKYDQAVEVYEKLLGYYPGNAIIRERLINLLFSQGQEEKARRHMKEIEKNSKPGDPGRQALGLIYLRQGKLDESIAELEMIVSAFPDDQKSRYYLATAYEDKGEPEKALEHFQKLNKESELYVNARIHVAFILENQEKHDEAIRVLEETISIQKDKPELYLMMASILEGQKKYTEALEILNTALNQDPNNPELIFRTGVVLDKAGEKDKCIDTMRKVLEISPDHADALNYIGYSYAEQGIRLDEAKRLVERALEIKPDSGYIIDSLGWVYYQKGLFDDAVRQLEKAVDLIPNDPTIAEHLGDAYFMKKDYAKSRRMYEKAKSLNHPEPEKIKEKIEKVIPLTKQH